MTKVPNTFSVSTDPVDRNSDPFWDPLYHATRILLAFAQGLFKTMPNGMYHWSEDPELTEILITDQAPITSSVLNHRPAIVTVRGQAQYLNLHMAGFETENHLTGQKTHRDIISSSITFNCLARVGVEASRIAWFLGSNIKALRHYLQQQGPFTQIGHEVLFMGESPPGMLLQDPGEEGTINLPVVVPFFFPHRWEVKDPTFSLDKIEANIYERIVSVNGASHAGLGVNITPQGALKPPNVRGRPIIPGPAVPLRTRVIIPNE